MMTDYIRREVEFRAKVTETSTCTNCRCAFKKDALWSRNYCPNCGAKMDGGVRT